jgi:glycosyltransferase involved in cell wall biosynthesis/peptidoglycan/xylan/chitin deacetylase (PgdA/CDA1 family)
MRRDPGTLTVLTYHRVAARGTAAPGIVSATPEAFARQMAWLARSGRAVGLEDVLAARRGRRPLRPDAVHVTFDDAYADFAVEAWPVLRSLGLPVTLFVPTAFPGHASRAFWWDRLFAAVQAGHGTATVEGIHVSLGTPDERLDAYRRLREHVKHLPHDRALAFVDAVVHRIGDGAGRSASSDVLGWDELRRLGAEGVALAPHTRTHPLLERLEPERLAGEIGGSVEDLRRETGAAPPAFAYPSGSVTEAAVRAAADAGIEVAFTTRRGVNDLAAPDWLRLSRVNVGRRSRRPLALRAQASRPAARALGRRWRHAAEGEAPVEREERPAVAYVMSRFPKISETFILTEILALERRGVRVEVYPLMRESEPLTHPEAAPVVARARFTPFLSRSIVASQLHWLRRAPRAYVGALRDLVTATAGSLNFLGGGLAIFPKAAHVARLMEDEGVVHVHCHFANHPAAAGFVISRLTGLPYSFTAHGSDLHKERRMLPEKVREAAFVATISEYNRRLIVDECGGDVAGKVHIVRAGVDTEVFSPVPRDAAAGHPLQILCVGTLQEVKGQKHLVDACALLAREGVDFRCRLVGEGPDREMLSARIAEAGLQDRVELLGARTRGEVAAELRRADVFVAPSVPTKEGKREGIPVVLMEAMSTGVPVVSSRLSGIPELVEHGEGGLLTPPGDAAALAAALRALAGDPVLRRRLGRGARERVVGEFDLERSVDRLLDHFGMGAAA